MVIRTLGNLPPLPVDADLDDYGGFYVQPGRKTGFFYTEKSTGAGGWSIPRVSCAADFYGAVDLLNYHEVKSKTSTTPERIH